MRYPIGNTIFDVLCVAGIAFASTSCALSSKADLVEIRYFSPERVRPRPPGTDPAQAAPAAANQSAVEVRLGRVLSGPSLRERIAHRDALYELGYYEDYRWTERPETYVRRELGRSLFEVHRLRRALGGAAPTLDVEVTAFDDLRLKTGRSVQIQLKVILYEDDDVLFEETLTVDRPVVGDKPGIEEVVAAMAEALESAASQVTLKVQRALEERRSATRTDEAPRSGQ